MTRFERKIVLIVVLTGLLPLLVTVFLADRLISETVGLGLRRSLLERLDRSFGYHRELLEAWKDGMDAQAREIATWPELDEAARTPDERRLQSLLGAKLPALSGDALHRPALVRLVLRDRGGRVLAAVQADGAPPASTHRPRDVESTLPSGHVLVATFVTPEEAIREVRRADELTRTYHELAAYRDEIRLEIFLTFVGILVVVLTASLALGLFLSRRVTRRIATLHEATEAVAAGDLTFRVPAGPDDEIGELVSAFNAMVQELGDNRAKIAYLSKISAWQDVARRLAHEIKNPLQPIQLAMQELHRRAPRGVDPEYDKLLDSTREIVGDEVRSLRRLTTEFSGFSRLPEVKPEPADLYELLREAAAAPQTEDDAHVHVEWHIPSDGCIVPMDRMLMRHVFDNLVRNAVEALRTARPDGSGRVVVSVERDTIRRRVRVKVSDNGLGIPPDSRDRIFEPYYTTKAEGTGLGLAIVKKIVLDHGGTIDVGEGPDGGADLVVSLPLRPASLTMPAVKG